MLQLAIPQAFDMALRHHTAGRLPQAEALYRQILAQEPNEPEALHLLGVIAHQVGRHDAAVELIGRAVAIRPTFAQAFGNLGLVLTSMGRIDEALVALRQAIALQPDYPEAYSSLGNALREKGRIDEATEAYRQALKLRPEYAEAHNNLGNALKDKGLLDEALGAYRQSVALDGGKAEAYYNLGNALQAKGELEGAMDAYRAALARREGFPEAHHNLGNALLEKGQVDAAVESLRRAIALNGSYAAAHCSLGNALRDRGDVNEAIAEYRQAIALQGDFSEAHNNLGTILRDRGFLDDAIAAYEKAVSLRPDNFVAHINLGNLLSQRERFDEALTWHRRALALKPNDPGVYEALGAALLLKFDSAEAEASFRHALALEPGSAKRWNALGTALNCLGQFTEASECFRHALALSPQGHYFRGLASTGRQAVQPEEIQRLHALVKGGDVPANDLIDAEFALGKLLDDGERFDEAFAHFAAGNRLFLETGSAAEDRFDGARLRRFVDRMEADFTRDFFAGKERWGDATELPVFIVGMPRSGTSLVEQIAASHPAVFGAGELRKVGELFARATAERAGEKGWPARWEAPEFAEASKTYLEHLQSLGARRTRVTDKMPDNIFHLGLIALMFPGARVIFCRRDPRDNCLSCYFERFDKNGLMYSYDLADCGEQYLETDRLMAHWLTHLPLRMLEIRYEALVSEQEVQSRRLIDFLGLTWDPACLEFHRTKRPVLTASFWQVRQPIYRRSAGRWRHYERHLGPLLKVLEKGQRRDEELRQPCSVAMKH